MSLIKYWVITDLGIQSYGQWIRHTGIVNVHVLGNFDSLTTFIKQTQIERNSILPCK